MLYSEAFDKLNEMERLEIARAVYNSIKSEYAKSEAGAVFHEELTKLDRTDLSDKIEEFEYSLNEKILEDNF